MNTCPSQGKLSRNRCTIQVLEGNYCRGRILMMHTKTQTCSSRKPHSPLNQQCRCDMLQELIPELAEDRAQIRNISSDILIRRKIL